MRYLFDDPLKNYDLRRGNTKFFFLFFFSLTQNKKKIMKEKFNTHSTFEFFVSIKKMQQKRQFHPFNYYKKISINYELHSDNGCRDHFFTHCSMNQSKDYEKQTRNCYAIV